jgi:myo-inositol-1(or 4)-monophosphatase
MTPELEAAITAASAAGDLLREHFSATHQIRHKGPADLVTEMDQQAEDLIARILQEAFPSYGLIGEEGGEHPAPDNPRWLVDPLDGTSNYVRGYPFFAVSIALERDDEIAVGVVYNPILDELFATERGRGATLNGRPIHVSTTVNLGDSLLASGFPYDAWTSEADNGQEWHRFLKCALSLRADGAAALDLCHVAMGRIDGYWELDLEPWDMAAGALIVQEAGGIVTRVNGVAYSPYGRSVLASNGHLHAEMLAVLAGN